MRKSQLVVFYMALIAMLAIFNVVQAQDTVWVWYGNVDGSPIDADISSELEIYAHVQTGDNVYVGNVLFNLAGDDVYFDDYLSETLGEWYDPFLTWDSPFFLPPSSGAPLPDGWSNQGFLAWSELFPPYNSTPLHAETPTQVLKYVFSTAANVYNIGNLVPALGPGYDPIQGPSNGSDTTGTVNFVIFEAASPVQFSGGGWVSGSITNSLGQSVANATVTCVQTDRHVMSDSDGMYTIGIAPGTYDILFQAEDHNDYTETGVSVTIDQTTTLNVVLEGGVGIDETFINLIPENFALKQNYPNPFNATTSIEYALTQDSHVELTVYDIQGRLIEKLVDSYQVAGTHVVNWNAEELASGMYLYKIQAGEHTQTNKMMLLK